MHQTAGKEKWMNWACRAFIVLDMYLVISGYIAWYQIKYQLVSPLIPQETITQIVGDSQYFEASLATSAFFLCGILFYTFNKKTVALLFLCLGTLAHEMISRFLIF